MPVDFCGIQNVKTLPPYHLFEKLGTFFVFDTTGCRFYKIDEITYRFLGYCFKHSIADAEQILLAEGKYSSEQIACVAAELYTLKENGLFDIPDYSMSDKEIDSALDKSYQVPITGLELALAENCNLACRYCYCSSSRNMPSVQSNLKR